MLKLTHFLLVCILAAGSLRAQSTRPSTTQADARSSAGPPSLVVLITIDGFPERNLERFAPQLHGGLSRLMTGGAWFTNAHHDHGITETAPGHATLLAGRFPRSTGIAANRAGVLDDQSPLINSAAPGASPRRFQGTTLADWLVSKNPQARILSVSSKDRAAILPIGRSKQQVYWYPGDGTMTTSRYYADSLPDWVNRFNMRRIPEVATGKTWALVLPDSAYKESDSVVVEGNGKDFTFPHKLPADTTATEVVFWTTPFGDELLSAFALEGVQAMHLGEGPQTDLLAISFSANDAVNHRYGPDSRESHDQMIRLDHTIGLFLDSLFKLREPSRVVVALTADHGFGTVPELARTVRPQPTRVTLLPATSAARQLMKKLRVDTTAFQLDQQALFIDSAAFRKAKVNPDTVLRLFQREALKIPGVARVDRWSDLLKGDTINDPITRRWVHQFPPSTPVEMLVTLTPGSLWGGPLVASHGTPYDYDSNVPIIFYGPEFKPGRYSEFVRTVDIAPTLAAAASVKPTEKLDGVVLTQVLK